MTATIEQLKPASPRFPHGPWVQTASGGAFDLLAQNPDQVAMRDIAGQLAKIARFAGATHAPYSVAQHSVEVSDFLTRLNPLAALYGLLHDAHEAYTGDITAPVKEALRQFSQYDALADLETAVQHTILKAVGLKPPSAEMSRAVHHADMVMLATERRDAMCDCVRDWRLDVPARAGKPLKIWNWAMAEEKFLDRYRTLTAHLNLQPIA